MDVNSITSYVKGWLYADQLIKPEEKVMFRPPTHGGLGMHHVKWKAMAGLVRSFLETACISKFQRSQYHSLLYRYHVLDDRSVPNPGYPPFYSAEFFSLIRAVHTESPLNIAQMSEKQWYRLLVEEQVTMEMNNGMWQYIPSQTELRSPEINWEESWRLARLQGLGPENSSFLFKLLHNTLVTQERLARTNPNINSLCKFPGCPGTENEDQSHALINCLGNNGTGLAVLNALKTFVPELTAGEALHLGLCVESALEMPLVFAMAVAWGSIWNLRQKRIRPQLYLVRAELEARVALLRQCRHFTNDAAIIDRFIENL